MRRAWLLVLAILSCHRSAPVRAPGVIADVVPTLSLTSLGTPVVSDRLFSDALSPDGAGDWNLLLNFYNAPNKNPTEWIIAKLGAGTYTRTTDQLWVAGQQGRYPNQNFHIANQMRAPNGTILFGAVDTNWWDYNATTQAITEHPQLPLLPGENFRDDSIYSQIFNTDGSLYWGGTIANTGHTEKRPQVFSIDPVTLAVTQYGRVGSLSHTLAAYAYYLHADGVGKDWMYVLVGQDIWDVVAIQLSTKAQFILAQGLTNNPWADFTEKPEGLVVNLYTNKNQANQTITSYWIVDGALYPYVAGYDPNTLPFTHRTVTKYTNPLVNPPQIDETVTPYAVNWRPFGSASTVPWTRVPFTLQYIAPIAVDMLVATATQLFGDAVQYQGWFSESGGATSFLGSGLDVSEACAVYVSVGGLVYVAGYPNGVLYVLDPSKAIDIADNLNPIHLGSFSNGDSYSGVKTAHVLKYGAQKGRIYMGGTRDRSGFGAGIGYWNIAAKTPGGHYTGLQLYTSNIGLAVFDGLGDPNRVVLSGKTSDGSDAQLIIHDLDLNELERQTPIAGMSDTGYLFRTSEHSVVVGFSPTAQLVYRWDISSQTLLKQASFASLGAATGGLATIADNGDGTITALIGGQLVKIDLTTLAMTSVGVLPAGQTALSTLVNLAGTYYATIGATLYQIATSGGQTPHTLLTTTNVSTPRIVRNDQAGARMDLTVTTQAVLPSGVATPSSVYVGTRVRIQSGFVKDGSPYTPTQSKLTVIDSDGTTTRYAYPSLAGYTDLTLSSTGVLYAEILCHLAGTVKYAWLSTASGEELADEGQIQVLPRTIGL